LFPAFAEHVGRIPGLFANLDDAPLALLSAVGLPEQPAVYAFAEHRRILQIGRTGNLKRRIQSHTRLDHRSSSFAFKLARQELDREPTYKKEGSRGALQLDPVFMQRFKKQVDRLKTMQLKYLLVDDPIDQYLLELYASMVFGLPLDEFDNH
jgi:hypothetical protein